MTYSKLFNLSTHHFLIYTVGIPIVITSWVVITIKLDNTSRLGTVLECNKHSINS